MTNSNPRSHSKGKTTAFGTASEDALKQAFDDGEREGRKQGYVAVLDLLHDDYMTSGYPLGSVEADAILTVTRRIAEKMREALK